MTLLASLFANSSLPSSLAIGPSALLPSQCQTTFHVCPASMTPGIAARALPRLLAGTAVERGRRALCGSGCGRAADEHGESEC
jgi:hypothetical protein